MGAAAPDVAAAEAPASAGAGDAIEKTGAQTALQVGDIPVETTEIAALQIDHGADFVAEGIRQAEGVKVTVDLGSDRVGSRVDVHFTFSFF